ncbi:MAG TPA: hypothetical protein VLY24_17030 [Bryobacteraceae bacterium]|nr:hypothetical protein [Bryobacteraceae bacterium]
MNQPSNTITTRLRATALTGLLLLFAAPIFAHGGFDHVIGTVVSVSNNVLTVKTAKGNVDVKLDDKTELTKSDQKAQMADLKPGTRVVVDIPEGSKDKVAHSVKLGTAGASPSPAEHHHE